MRQILKLDIKDIDRYTEIAYDAYPSFKDLDSEALKSYKADVKKYMLEDDSVTFYGMFDNDKMVAVMRLFDFETNLFGKILKTSGIGFLGVALDYKKKKAARDMLKFYEKTYRDIGVPIGSLLPFRPDFYRRMGYGFGSKISKYVIPASRFPACYDEVDIRKVNKSEYYLLDELHDSVVESTHGMNRKLFYEKKSMQKELYNKVFALYEDGKPKGYINLEFRNGKDDNYTINNMYIHELIYDSPSTFKRLLGFIKKQEEQVTYVIIPTCNDDLYHVFNDPRNNTLNYIPFGYLESNTQGVGMMYKIFDIAEVFRTCNHRDYNGVDALVKIEIEDGFVENSVKEIVVRFINGRAIIVDDIDSVDLCIKTDIASFSSMFMGVVLPGSLYRMGMLEISDSDMIPLLDRAFNYHQKPQTNTDF